MEPIKDIDYAQRQLFDDIPEDHTVLNQFTSNLTDGVASERKASSLLDQHRTDGGKTYHFVGIQHSIGRVMGDEKAGLICAVNKMRIESNDCTFPKSGLSGLKTVCDYFSPGSTLCKPSKKTQSLQIFLEQNAKTLFVDDADIKRSNLKLNKSGLDLNKLKKYPVCRPHNAAKLFAVLWQYANAVLEWIKDRILIYDDLYIRAIQQYLQCPQMLREAIFWSVYDNGYISPMQTFANSDGQFTIARFQFIKAHGMVLSLRTGAKPLRLSAFTFGASSLCDQPAVYGMHSVKIRTILSKTTATQTATDKKVISMIKKLDSMLLSTAYSLGIMLQLSPRTDVLQLILEFVNRRAHGWKRHFHRYVSNINTICDDSVRAHLRAVMNVLFNSKMAQYYGVSTHFQFMRHLINTKKPFLPFFREIQSMIIRSLPQFIFKRFCKSPSLCPLLPNSL